MSIEYTTLTPDNRRPVYDSLIGFWNQSWDPSFTSDFLDWRYGKRRHGETLVAMSGDKCVAMIDTFRRPYRVGGEVVDVLEPCDWFCLPDHRGMGLRMMKYLMSKERPLLGVGLPESAIAIGPRLKWEKMGETREYVLPISIRRAAGAALRRFKLGNGKVMSYFPPGVRLRSNASWTAHGIDGGAVEDLALANYPQLAPAPEYAVAPVMTKEYFEWLLQAPQLLGDLVGLLFRLRGSVVGITVSRIEPSPLGKRAKIIHMQAMDLGPDILKWMIAATVARTAAAGAEAVHHRTSCARTCSALSALHFHETERQDIIVWFDKLSPGAGLSNITLLRGDDSIIPSLINK